MHKSFLACVCILLISSCAAATSLPTADRVVVIKSERKLYLESNGTPFRVYRIALGPKPRGQKQQQGDQRTPEGRYLLDFKNDKSDFYKSIHISYPSLDDRLKAFQKGVDPGGAIMIHGLPNENTQPATLVQLFNWTDGCIAVTNEEMDEIWEAVEIGTPIDILP